MSTCVYFWASKGLPYLITLGSTFTVKLPVKPLAWPRSFALRVQRTKP